MRAKHQFIDRHTRQVRDEPLYADRWIRCLYSPAMERSGKLYQALTSRRWSRLIATWNYDSLLGQRLTGGRRFLERMRIDLSECLDPAESLDTLRKVFERRIRYWECRPLASDERAIVAPSDSRMLIGSLEPSSQLFLKEKFFACAELLGGVSPWIELFRHADAAIFRLTPEKYHYNHCPVAGVARAIYRVDGRFHACNPTAAVAVLTPYSKNERVVTIIDTDAPGGTGVGRVAMVEVAAMMIGDIVQAYSEEHYDAPRGIEPGMWLRRGQPKSLFRPGASTVVLLFEPGRVRFAADLIENLRRPVKSRYAFGFGASLTETDVAARSLIGLPAECEWTSTQPSGAVA